MRKHKVRKPCHHRFPHSYSGILKDPESFFVFMPQNLFDQLPSLLEAARIKRHTHLQVQAALKEQKAIEKRIAHNEMWEEIKRRREFRQKMAEQKRETDRLELEEYEKAKAIKKAQLEVERAERQKALLEKQAETQKRIAIRQEQRAAKEKAKLEEQNRKEIAKFHERLAFFGMKTTLPTTVSTEPVTAKV